MRHRRPAPIPRADPRRLQLLQLAFTAGRFVLELLQAINR